MQTLNLASEEFHKYLKRIGVEESDLKSVSKKEQLHLLQNRHCLRIPFENTQVLFSEEKIPISVNLTDIFEKLITSNRGGYCFEQNSLFFAVLQTLGFQVEIKPARVIVNTTKPQQYNGLTHIILIVCDPDNPSEKWFADCGFGGYNPVAPLLLVENQKTTSAGIDYYFKKVETHTSNSLTNKSDMGAAYLPERQNFLFYGI